MATLLWALGAWCAEPSHTVPYVPPASSEGHLGVVRIESRSAVSGEVRVVAADDAGRRVEAGSVRLGPRAAVEFDAEALEWGDASLGLAGTGPGEGGWRLELTTELDIEARAYARSGDFLAALHDATLVSGEEVELPFLRPGPETGRRSALRLASAGDGPATLSVRGIDDAGGSGGPVTVELGAGEAASYAASELESGAAPGLSGSLGGGEGDWRLAVSATAGAVYATSLLLDGPGTLSSVPGGMSPGSIQRVPLFPSASDGEGRRGLVRVVNRAAEAAEVGIEAFDGTERAYERLKLGLGAASSEQFDSADLEHGNAAKGLEGSTGPGEGDWWLELTGADIEVLSHVDSAPGALSAIRGTRGVETEAGLRYEALVWGDAGELRLLNAGGEAAAVRITGVDDAGAPGGEVSLAVAPWSVRTLAAAALEEGGAGLVGALGAGSGGWRLVVEADAELDVLSLVRGPGGMLSDVSRRGRPAGAPPRAEVIDAMASVPDLWVAASASDAELSPGESFELAATVGNRGRAESSPTTLRYYRSADAAITAADAEVGSAAVAALAAGGSVRAPASMTAQAPGEYYYGACVDAVEGEASVSNNCSSAVEVTVVAPESEGPDLTATAGVSKGALEAGEPFTLEAVVRNVGGAGSAATTLRYYRSADARIARSDAEVGTDAVAALAASGESAESIELAAPSTAGEYYYGACVDAVRDEASVSNNCSSAVEVTVVAPESEGPDLTATAGVSKGALEAGEPFTLEAVVRNVGGAGSAATTLRYYRSADAAITPSDAELGTDAVAALAASGESAESIELAAPSTAGEYYYGACVDAVEGEANTANNCSRSVEVAVRERGPDLVVSASTDATAVRPGSSVFAVARVRNIGNENAAGSILRWRRSEDATISRRDEFISLSDRGVPPLERDRAFSPSGHAIVVPDREGTYYYGACVEPVEGETNVSNNCSAALEVAVRADATQVPDLEVTAVALRVNRVAATVTNVGSLRAHRTKLRFYCSADAERSSDDVDIGLVRHNLPPLVGKGKVKVTVYMSEQIRSYGHEYYYACADAVNGEVNTANNCSEVLTLKI